MKRFHGLLLLLLIVLAVGLAGFFSGRASVSVPVPQDPAVVRELTKAVADHEAASQAAEARAGEWESRAVAAEAKLARAPRPAPPAPPPVLDQDLAKGLVLAGLAEGLAVRVDLPASALTPPDGRKVWEWKELAGRVPGLELRLTSVEQAAEARKGQTVELHGALREKDVALIGQRALTDSAYAAKRSADRQLEAERWKKFGYGAGGVLAGFVLGKAVAR